jgi:hypothetical protein
MLGMLPWSASLMSAVLSTYGRSEAFLRDISSIHGETDLLD